LAKLDEAKEGSLIQVVDPAIVPDYKSFPKRGLITIIAAFAGLIIGIFIALFQEGMSRLREDPEQNERLSALRSRMDGALISSLPWASATDREMCTRAERDMDDDV